MEGPGEQKDTAYKNVTARLWNSNPVRVAMDEMLEGVRGVLGLGKVEEGRKRRVRAKDFEREGAGKEREGAKKEREDGGDERGAGIEEEEVEEDGGDAETRREEEELSIEDAVDEDREEEEREVMIGMDISGDESEDYDRYASRIADSLNDEGSSDGDENHFLGRRKQSSFSPFPSDSSHPTTSQHPKAAKPPKTTAKPLPKPKTTTFLPSLTAGYWSNSDSDASDPDSDAGEMKPRKNRMGQQARRALWEKKFGAKANHIKSQSQSQSRDQGWDARKGAQGGDERGSRGRRKGGGGGKGQRSRPPNMKGASGANSDPLGERKKGLGEKEGPLHPSWEAAKKKKEVKITATYEGKKIVFD